MKDFDEKVAIVTTTGCGIGIEYCITKTYAASGANIVIAEKNTFCLFSHGI